MSVYHLKRFNTYHSFYGVTVSVCHNTNLFIKLAPVIESLSKLVLHRSCSWGTGKSKWKSGWSSLKVSCFAARNWGAGAAEEVSWCGNGSFVGSWTEGYGRGTGSEEAERKKMWLDTIWTVCGEKEGEEEAKERSQEREHSAGNYSYACEYILSSAVLCLWVHYSPPWTVHFFTDSLSENSVLCFGMWWLLLLQVALVCINFFF